MSLLPAWPAAAAAFIAQGCTYGLSKSQGVIFLYLADYFGSSHFSVSLILLAQVLPKFIVCLLLPSGLRIFSSRCVAFFGASMVCFGLFCAYIATISGSGSVNILLFVVFFGLLPGLGFECVNTNSMMRLPEWFTTNLAVAAGFAFSGASVGGLLLPFSIKWAYNTYQFTGVFLLLLALEVQLFVAAMLMWPQTSTRTDPALELTSNLTTGLGDEVPSSSEEKGEKGDPILTQFTELVKLPYFLPYLLSVLFAGGGFICFDIFLPTFARKDVQCTEEEAVSLPVIGSALEIVLRIGAGLVVNTEVMSPLRIQQVILVFSAGCLLFVPFVKGFIPLVAYVCLDSLTTSLYAVAIIPCTVKLVGRKNAGSAWSLINSVFFISVVMIPLSAFLADIAGGHTYTFYFCSGFYVLAAVCLQVAQILHSKSQSAVVSAAIPALSYLYVSGDG